MYGTSNQNGQYVFGLDHLRQSVADILTTPLNSRTMVRGYGSRLFELVDSPINAEFRVRATEAIYMALQRWEPRLALDRVDVTGHADGTLAITLTGTIATTEIPFEQSLTVNREQLS